MSLWKKKPTLVEEANVAPAPIPVPSSSQQSLNELVLQSIHEGVLIVGPDQNIRLANPAAVAMLGRSPEEILGLNYDSIVNLIDKTGNRISESRNPIAKAFAAGEFGEVRDLDLVSQDSGKNTPISIIVTPANDQQSGLIVTFRDIAEELKEEHERSDFISTASHEMRTPVASIEGYLGLAMNPSTATIDERAKSYLEKAHEASQHLGRLFQDLLDTTKLDDGQLAPRLAPVEVSELVHDIADAQAEAIKQKGLEYQFGDAENGQQLSGGRRIEQVIYANLDQDFLREILNNLIENAIKYTPSGWITVSVRADQYNVQIIVADTGIGIPREELTHVFQKFYRVDNRDTREIGGTGLGLYLVKQRVEAMNGRIWAESEVGKGTRFITLFPRISADTFAQQQFLKNNIQQQNKI